MITEEELIVGKNGEILPKKRMREISGIQPGDRVIVRAMDNELIIKKVLSVDEVFNLSKIDSNSPKNLKIQIREEINK